MAGLAERAADTVLTLPAEPPASPAATPIWYDPRVARARGQQRGQRAPRSGVGRARARIPFARAPRAPARAHCLSRWSRGCLGRLSRRLKRRALAPRLTPPPPSPSSLRSRPPTAARPPPRAATRPRARAPR